MVPNSKRGKEKDTDRTVSKGIKRPEDNNMGVRKPRRGTTNNSTTNVAHRHVETPMGDEQKKFQRNLQGHTLTPYTDCEIMALGPSDCIRRTTNKALWDTGAVFTTITKQMADQLDLEVAGEENVGSIGGNVRAGRAMINIKLDSIVIPFVNVNVIDLAEREQEAKAQGIDYHHPDIWIGMDVIGQGRFEIDSTGDETILTFEL